MPALAVAQQKHLKLEEPPSRGRSTFWARPDDALPDARKQNNDVRALATLAPTGNVPVRRDSLAGRLSGPSAGLSSRRTARSLQDWKVEDLVLLATIDGSIHARDRTTGARRWVMESEQPMVETVYHSRNKSLDGYGTGPDNYLWVVEPSQGGSLYSYIPETTIGMQRLGLTVKQLAGELSPYEFGEPALVYTGETQTTVYTVDVSNGRVLKMFSSRGSAVFDDTSCRTINDLEASDETNPVTGTMSLGRSEYKVDINNKATGDHICTIRYFEWGPNNADLDLINQYTDSKDNRYIYSRFDGSVIAQDYLSVDERGALTDPQPLYQSKLPTPVVRVFDLARRKDDESGIPPFVILPQPIVPPAAGETPNLDQVFVNCTAAGSWFALSELQYPYVTDGATSALCTRDGWEEIAVHLSNDANVFRKGLIGVHNLQALSEVPLQARHLPLIGAPPEPAALPPPQDMIYGPSQQSSLPTVSTASPFFWAILAVTLLLGIAIPKHGLKLSFKSLQDLAVPKASLQQPFPDVSVEKSIPTTPSEAAAEATAKSVQFDFGPTDPAKPVSVNGDAAALNTAEEAKQEAETKSEARDETPTGKKKKAHRGKRGGRKEREKSLTEAAAEETKAVDGTVEGVEQDGKDTVIKPDVVSKAVVEEAGVKGLDNLRIHTDRVLGSGSGGTFVFEGEFEGRQVAVKRMLPQYYELASQEVTLLQNSEEHPHVIRYYCRREDQHFLYIALELCQASLWDLFRDGRHDEAPEPKFTALSQHMLSDPRRILRQMAEGIKYLHTFRIVHRDIKPQNMLIAYPKKNSVSDFPRVVISDFGLCKTLPDNVSTLVGTTGHAGTAGWKAPELIFQPKEMLSGSQNSTARSENGDQPPGSNAAGVKRAVDIFSLGCVFFYVLTGGQHPFDDEEGWMQLRERNIKTGRMNMVPLEMLGPDTLDLVRWMLAHNPEDRPTATQVLAHPFFWDAEDRLEFLSTASDRFDQEVRDGSSAVLNKLESRAADIIPAALVGSNSHISAAMHGHLRNSDSIGGGLPASTMHLPVKEPNFLSVLDRRFVETIGRQRKYDPSRLTDLLRALRNKHHHWDDMPEDVKVKVGEVPEGYLGYWEARFPGLVVQVWRTVIEAGICGERRFMRWFANKGN